MNLKEEMQLIFQSILENKILKKHEQYGNSLEEPINVFNGIVDTQLLIDVRADDKLKRMQSLRSDDPKYWSEIEEIIAYLLWKLVLHEREEMINESCSSDNRYPGISEQSSGNTGKKFESRLPDTIIRRLSDFRKYSI